MKIHSLFILKNSGACIYDRKFTEVIQYDVNLISPFFSAIFSFAEKIISRNIEILEMGEFRFIFSIEKNYIFVVLADSTVSILFLNTRLTRIKSYFFQKYSNHEALNDYEQIEDTEFDQKIDSIISGKEEISKSGVLYRKIIELFKNLLFKNEIIGAAVFTTDGNIIYSSLPEEILVKSLKELEIRFMTGVTELPELFYSLENGQKVFSKLIKIPWKLDHFLIVLLFDKNIPLGMAEITLKRTEKKIINLI